jgi:hypothetical protein
LGTAISGVTIINQATAFESIPEQQFPVAVVVFNEQEPEYLAFKQERRKINGTVYVGKRREGTTVPASVEVVNGWIDAFRDAMFGDTTLSSTVDGVVVGSASVFGMVDDNIVYGEIDVNVDEVF